MRALNLVFAVATALALSATLASAQQAAPGISVENRVSLSYTSGSATVTNSNAASVTFVVDRKIDLSVAGQNAGSNVSTPHQTNAVLTYRVRNLGNDEQRFDIDVANTGGLGLTYSPSAANGVGTYWVVVSNSATPPTGTPTLYNATGMVSAGNVAAGGDLYVHVFASVASSVANGTVGSFAVTATAVNGATPPVIVTEVRNQGLSGVDTILADPLNNGIEAATQTLTVSAPVLAASKTVAVISENLGGTFNCATGSPQTSPAPVAMIPGACIEYTITVTNNATAGTGSTATSLTITDALPSNVTYAAHATGSFTSVSRSGSTVTGTLGSLAAGASASFTIRATIGTP